ncbi:MAG: M42 family metallopeptidase [Candidatus Omnitrophica bacterium]|nr:M42 family metallopeptidase [Candidatus Omnitrophota bacterium]MBU1127923.1 M42 family metallopeptidase [Candidatus Omnitrophota bacterium]MBU1784304.1 M42 family metallopeptidase [Candidatus Omnitrophota bacterium]MBU1851606.1 M42 family metallopeptidase [Candidatus Omnitrophota bacterium]
MRTESLDFLKKLINSHSPSGSEGEAAAVWKRRTKAAADSVSVDVHGNSIGVMNASGRPRVMLAGHIDEIGYMVKYVDKEGYIYFSAIGGVDLHLVPGQRVWIKGKNGDVFGIVGRKPIHHQTQEERKQVAKIEDMWIDIGAKNDKEVLSSVSIGDSAVPAVGFDELKGTRVAGRGLDDRAGAFVVSECLRLLAGKKLKASVHGVATVQEEIGIRGARTSAYGISPDVGIAIDVAFATDMPGMNKKHIGEIALGKGPVIARGPNINPKVFELLVAAAKREKISYQVEGISRGTGTDANIMQLTKSGVATGLVSIPNRNMHSPVEVVDLKDMENAARLLAAFILKLDEKTNFIPY